MFNVPKVKCKLPLTQGVMLNTTNDDEKAKNVTEIW